jgi:hypothetical protein
VVNMCINTEPALIVTIGWPVEDMDNYKWTYHLFGLSQ